MSESERETQVVTGQDVGSLGASLAPAGDLGSAAVNAALLANANVAAEVAETADYWEVQQRDRRASLPGGFGMWHTMPGMPSNCTKATAETLCQSSTSAEPNAQFRVVPFGAGPNYEPPEVAE